MSNRDNWVVEIYPAFGDGDHIAKVEFGSLPLLRTAIVDIRDKKFIVAPPTAATAADRITLLDMRAQGFDIAIRTRRSIERKPTRMAWKAG